MKAVIIDDERLARDELRGLLCDAGDVEIIGEASNATEAIALLARVTPDVLFLDIEMPGRTGFDLLAALPRSPREIVFVTAYDSFAVQAFAANALDYLLKPVKPGRLAETLERVRMRIKSMDTPGGEPETPAPSRPLGEQDQFFVRDGERCWFVPVRSIVMIEAEGGAHARLHLGDGQPLIHRSLSALEARLPSSLFFRANRSQLVNRLHIGKVEPWFSGSLKVTLTNGVELEFSRRQAQLFRESLGL